MQLEIEIAGLKHDKDKATAKRREALEAELAELKSKGNEMRARWDNEKNAISKLRELRETLELTRQSLERAERDYNLEKAAELRHGTIPGIEVQIKEAEAKLNEKRREPHAFRKKSAKKILPLLSSRWTHIPVNKLIESEKLKLLALNAHLHERVIGQNEAV